MRKPFATVEYVPMMSPIKAWSKSLIGFSLEPGYVQLKFSSDFKRIGTEICTGGKFKQDSKPSKYVIKDNLMCWVMQCDLDVIYPNPVWSFTGEYIIRPQLGETWAPSGLLSPTVAYSQYKKQSKYRVNFPYISSLFLAFSRSGTLRVKTSRAWSTIATIYPSFMNLSHCFLNPCLVLVITKSNTSEHHDSAALHAEALLSLWIKLLCSSYSSQCSNSGAKAFLDKLCLELGLRLGILSLGSFLLFLPSLHFQGFSGMSVLGWHCWFHACCGGGDGVLSLVGRPWVMSSFGEGIHRDREMEEHGQALHTQLWAEFWSSSRCPQRGTAMGLFRLQFRNPNGWCAC